MFFAMFDAEKAESVLSPISFGAQDTDPLNAMAAPQGWPELYSSSEAWSNGEAMVRRAWPNR